VPNAPAANATALPHKLATTLTLPLVHVSLAMVHTTALAWLRSVPFCPGLGAKGTRAQALQLIYCQLHAPQTASEADYGYFDLTLPCASVRKNGNASTRSFDAERRIELPDTSKRSGRHTRGLTHHPS
jgi:hypothetical protein